MSADARVHVWAIPERETARHLARRGRIHAFQTLDPAATALVVVDMVPFFAADSPYVRGIAPNINAIAGALRSRGGIVAWVLPSGDDPHPALSREFLGERQAETYRTSGGAGDLRERLCPGLAAADGDLYVEKRSASALMPGYCSLHAELSGRRITTVIVTGTVTNVCCEATVRDARALGYRAILVADASAAASDEMHNASLLTVYRSFGDVRATADVLAMIGAA